MGLCIIKRGPTTNHLDQMGTLGIKRENERIKSKVVYFTRYHSFVYNRIEVIHNILLLKWEAFFFIWTIILIVHICIVVHQPGCIWFDEEVLFKIEAQQLHLILHSWLTSINRLTVILA